jgi:GTP-binding protein
MSSAHPTAPGRAPLIAIVGRPNVGKSTLYNRLVGGRPAIVHDTPGLTRDRRYGEFDYFGRQLRLVDTGGLDPEAEREVIGAGIHRQARVALAESDAILFVVDGTAGLTSLDLEVAALLRRQSQPVFVVVNKLDSSKRELLTGEFFRLGMGDPYPVSAVHGRGVDELLEAVVAALPAPVLQAPDGGAAASEAGMPGAGDDSRNGDEDGAVAAPLRIAFVGKPNAGKSSLVNRLLGVERALVHHVPGTTTDPVDTPFEYGGKPYVLVDTAGLRRRARVDGAVERIAAAMALDQVRDAQVAVLAIDATLGPSEQDARIAGVIQEGGTAVVVALNKADLLEGPGAERRLRELVARELHFIDHAPVQLLSAQRGDGVAALMERVDEVAREHRRRVSTAELNRFFAEVVETHPPPVQGGKRVRIYYITQGGVQPPTFLLWANHPELVSASYRRYVLNQLRRRYGFAGTPLRVVVKAKRSSRARPPRPARRPVRRLPRR